MNVEDSISKCTIDGLTRCMNQIPVSSEVIANALTNVLFPSFAGIMNSVIGFSWAKLGSTRNNSKNIRRRITNFKVNATLNYN